MAPTPAKSSNPPPPEDLHQGADLPDDHDVSVAFGRIVETIRARFDFQRASIVVLDASGEAYLRAASFDGAGGQTERSEVPVSENVRRVVRTGVGVVNHELSSATDPNSLQLLRSGIRSTMVAPLIVDDRVIGTLNLGSGRDAAYDESDLAMLGQIADRFAGSVAAAHESRTSVEAASLRHELLHSDRLVSLGQLVASVAHEINNPASYILTNVEQSIALLEQLQSSPNPSDEAVLDELLAMSRDNLEGIDRITSIVRGLREFSRAGVGVVDVVDINDVVRAALRLADNRIRHAAKLRFLPSELPRISGDRIRLTQLFVNLLVNAAQAIKPGLPREHRITVTTTGDSTAIRVRVDDTGCGIPEQRLMAIFDAFYTTKPEGVGTGLGLAVCDQIAREHGGSINVTSEEGVGSSFTVSLPVRRLDARLPEPPTSRPRSAPSRRGRILVVDDDLLVLRGMARALGRQHDVVTVDSGRAALELLEVDGAFDAVICDVTMPGMNGPTFYERLALIEPTLQPRTLFFTGGALEPSVERFLESMAHRLLRKPVSAGDILLAVAQVMNSPST